MHFHWVGMGQERQLSKLCLSSFWKGSALKGENIAPQGSKFFAFRGDQLGVQEYKQEVTEYVSLVRNGGISTKYIQSL